MPRRPIPPARRKKPVSVTLTPEQVRLLEWAAAQGHESASVLVGRLIEAEARRISKKRQVPLPDLNPAQISIQEPGHAVQDLRQMLQQSGGKRSAVTKKSS